MFNSVNQAFEWMVSFTNLEKKPDLSKRGYRLDKMIKILELFNNPHYGYNIIHVAGSKGKGSTCGFLSSILTEAGFKTGIYSSPHLLDYRERITINHSFFNNSVYLETIQMVKDKLDKVNWNAFLTDEPTTFELMTLVAFIIFKKEQCQWVVLETGLGGRLDSTNVVDPIASVITKIELEHTEILGDTLGKIAFEKGGIIKPNKPTFTSNTNQEILRVLEDITIDKNCKLYTNNINAKCELNNEGTFLKLKNNRYKLGLEGNIQGENALLAINTINKVLPNLSNNVIKNGLLKTKIPGRFQIIKFNNKNIVLDGAHTKDSMESTVKTFNRLFNNGTIIFGAIKGKDITSMINLIDRKFNNIIVSTPGNFKESDIETIIDIFTSKCIDVIKCIKPEDALKLAMNLSDNILVSGSFYMAGEIAKLIIKYEE